ncbi:MAG: hypothetical protein A2X36_00895 [Elusimicrobia bacterium GWA2_69_24]|nr:MAG: hypothetical protein A2X36_00895 [Elusimicrobia bacterium GWA2_69_24]HBL16534.1 RNA-binding protein [Elusimicrobiota bacterium]
MKELASYLAKNLVDAPDQVEVSSAEDEHSVRVTVRVADPDKGKIIGKQGKVIKAIRAVVGIAAAKSDRKVMLDLE